MTTEITSQSNSAASSVDAGTVVQTFRSLIDLVGKAEHAIGILDPDNLTKDQTTLVKKLIVELNNHISVLAPANNRVRRDLFSLPPGVDPNLPPV